MWQWLKARGAWLLACGLAVFGAGAFVAARRRKEALARAAADLEVVRARSSIEVLRGKRQALAEHEPELEHEIAKLDERIAENKQKLASVHAEYGLSSEEIAAELERLGY